MPCSLWKQKAPWTNWIASGAFLTVFLWTLGTTTFPDVKWNIWHHRVFQVFLDLESFSMTSHQLPSLICQFPKLLLIMDLLLKGPDTCQVGQWPMGCKCTFRDPRKALYQEKDREQCPWARTGRWSATLYLKVVFYPMTMRKLPCEAKFCGEDDEWQGYQLDQMDLYLASIAVMKLPIFGVSMEMYGHFEGFIIECVVWVRNIMTPVPFQPLLT